MEKSSAKAVDLPVMICSKRHVLEVGVVVSDILAVTKLDNRFSKNQTELLSNILTLNTSSSGHCCIPLSYFVSQKYYFVFNIDQVCGVTNEKKRRETNKLHRQFCHVSSDQLIRLLNNASFYG